METWQDNTIDNYSRDSKIQSAEVPLPSQNIISFCQVVSLELPMKPPNKKLPENVPDNEVLVLKDSDRDLSSIDSSIGKTVSEISNISAPVEDKSKRKEFVQAHKAIQGYLNDDFTTVLFCFPQECRDDDQIDYDISSRT